MAGIGTYSGMSRSGMSIIGGMMAGVDRQRATQFSFYLALPTLGAATIYTLLRNISHLNSSSLGLLFLGTLVSGIVAWASIGWLLRYVARNSFIPFGYYRIVIGFVILILHFIL
ncbi:MAG: undecaprenyl-diphosphate phosphatase [Anaerolineae bacterium]|nr:undecaprenyl-diphosphate phosphatase [Anaerolineae bacterium]